MPTPRSADTAPDAEPGRAPPPLAVADAATAQFRHRAAADPGSALPGRAPPGADAAAVPGPIPAAPAPAPPRAGADSAGRRFRPRAARLPRCTSADSGRAPPPRAAGADPASRRPARCRTDAGPGRAPPGAVPVPTPRSSATAPGAASGRGPSGQMLCAADVLAIIVLSI
jgi:hypothetical protein